MPKSNVLKNPTFRARKRKYDHDLSCVKKFSSSVSQLLPVFYDFCYPGDKYDFRTEMFTQLREIVSPAMTHIEESVEWFFVPAKAICHTAPDSFTAVQDFHSTFVPNHSDLNATPFPVRNFKNEANMVKTFIADNWNYGMMFNHVSDTFDLEGIDEFGVPYYFNLLRLSQLLGYGYYFFDIDSVGSLTHDLLLNVNFACVYQKIFMDCFRIDNRIDNDANYYNLDRYAIGGLITESVFKFFKMRYTPWAKDFFTSSLPSPLVDYGNIGMQHTEGSHSLADVNQPLSDSPSMINDGNRTVTIGQNLADFRVALAVEKLMEITRRAKKDYNSQILAHFGFDVPMGVSDNVYRLGSETTIFNINEVVALSDGTNGQTSTSLGQKGGRGSAYRGMPKKGIRFTAPCHGFLMAIYHAVPQADYSATGLDKLNTYRLRQDYWMPEFDQLGMSPTYIFQLAFDTVLFENELTNGIMGWNYRYLESKLKQNLCYGIFTTNETFKSWTTQRDFTSVDLAAQFTNPEFFYISPTFIDSFMLLHFQNAADDKMNPTTCFARDPMLHWFRFVVHKSSEISAYSMPSL